MKHDHVSDGIAGSLGALLVVPASFCLIKLGAQPAAALLASCPIAGVVVAIQSWVLFGRRT